MAPVSHSKAAAFRSVDLVQQGMVSQLQMEKRGLILCFKMVKMSEGREIYTKKRGKKQGGKTEKEKEKKGGEMTKGRKMMGEK